MGTWCTFQFQSDLHFFFKFFNQMQQKPKKNMFFNY